MEELRSQLEAKQQELDDLQVPPIHPQSIPLPLNPSHLPITIPPIFHPSHPYPFHLLPLLPLSFHPTLLTSHLDNI